MPGMRRREFISLLGGAAAAWPLAAARSSLTVCGALVCCKGVAEDDPEMQARLAAFRQGLEKIGSSQGRNVRIDYHFAFFQRRAGTNALKARSRTTGVVVRVPFMSPSRSSAKPAPSQSYLSAFPTQ